MLCLGEKKANNKKKFVIRNKKGCIIIKNCVKVLILSL